MHSSKRNERLLVGVLALSAIAGLLVEPSSSRSQERTVAGSVQEGYLYVPTAEDNTADLDGFTTELSLKISADASDHVSAQAKVCFGCHGFELGMAFADIRVADELNFRVGRFSPSFGEFPLRHDPANHATVDKPLPYDMGRMVRLREWNMSVLPIPYVDNGLEINGTHWFGDSTQLDYALYAVGGLRGPSDGADVDFVESRSAAVYYVDNNPEPAVGGRVSLTLVAGEDVTLTSGVSGMVGRYDPEAELHYVIVGADFYARLGPLALRTEYLIRRTEMWMGDDPVSRFRYGPTQNGFDNYFLKDGFYAEAELEAGEYLRFVLRADGMRRIGNVVRTSPLRSRSAVLRYTAGFNVLPHRNVRLKLFGQLYDFSDFEDAVAVQGAVTATF